MKFTVIDEDYVIINDETGREILLDDIYLLTNSKKLVNYLIKNIGIDFELFRTTSKFDSHKRLILTHTEFHNDHYYYNIKDGKRYKCLGVDKITGEAMLRQTSGNKRKLKYSKNIREWVIIT